MKKTTRIPHQAEPSQPPACLDEAASTSAAVPRDMGAVTAEIAVWVLVGISFVGVIGVAVNTIGGTLAQRILDAIG